ncbi:hypothetical protein PVAP13_3NG183035 [Panicum virgatum]|uniref:Uncharacterized protein n=1 Tax=Panicum virgatum TaxID=38727 RepID=A0A8T0U459_PANVG|nr:hypothetical protein PVAP13_3NG183035 [Panicum virgatum]
MLPVAEASTPAPGTTTRRACFSALDPFAGSWRTGKLAQGGEVIRHPSPLFKLTTATMPPPNPHRSCRRADACAWTWTDACAAGWRWLSASSLVTHAAPGFPLSLSPQQRRSWLVGGACLQLPVCPVSFCFFFSPYLEIS